MRKVHSLTGRITPKLMRQAFRNVKRNRGAAGVDRVSIAMFAANLDGNLHALMRDMKGRTYIPLPLRRAYIPKGPSQLRPLGIPAVRDRVAQDVCRQLLEPILTPEFHACSFDFIKGRNCHQAIQRLLELKNSGLGWVVDADIRSFFDEIPLDLIMRLLARRVADGTILTLVERFLRAGVMEDGRLRPSTKGTPQGGLISPLLANLVLNELDWQLEASGAAFVRCADDFVLLCPTRTAAEEALALVRRVIEDEMELRLHPEKTRLVRFSAGFEFLGFRISSTSVRMRDKAVERFKTRIRTLTVRSHNLDTDAIERLNRVLRGTVNYFGMQSATVKTQFTTLDRWLRTRLRCMKFKRIWKTDRRRLRHKHIAHLELLARRDLLTVRQQRLGRPPCGLFLGGRPVQETCTPVNAGNQPRCDNGKEVVRSPGRTTS